MYIPVYIQTADLMAQGAHRLLAVSRPVRKALCLLIPTSLSLSLDPLGNLCDSTTVLYYTLLGLSRPGSGAGNHLVIGFHAASLYHGTP